MSKILQGSLGVLFYIDGIIVFRKNENESLTNLTTLLQRIKDVALKLNGKCVFGVPELSLLEHRITVQGISPLPEKIAPIMNTPAPTDMLLVGAPFSV